MILGLYLAWTSVQIFILPQVSSATISVSPSAILSEGDNMTITCRNHDLKPRTLQKARLNGRFVDVITYFVRFGSLYYDWNFSFNDFLGRQKVRMGRSETSAVWFSLTVSSLRCSDGGTYRCRGETQNSTDTINVTVHSRIRTRITGAEPCDVQTDPGCARCSTNGTGLQPKYGRVGEPLVLTCGGQLATPSSMNTIRWYKQTSSNKKRHPVVENATEIEYDVASGSSYSVTGRSVLTYYPQPTDSDLLIFCETSYLGSEGIVTAQVSVCVQGLDLNPETTPPLAQTASEAQHQGEAGKIAGAVLGGALGGAVLVLLLALVFLRLNGYSITGPNKTLELSPISCIKTSRRPVPEQHINTISDNPIYCYIDQQTDETLQPTRPTTTSNNNVGNGTREHYDVPNRDGSGNSDPRYLTITG